MTKLVRIILILVAIGASVAVMGLKNPILGLDLRGGVMLLLEADFSRENFSAAEKEAAIEQVVETIRFRVNESGLAETVVTRSGDERVWVEIPCPAPPADCSEPSDVRDLIERRGFLEFKKVIAGPVNPSTTTASINEELRYDISGNAFLIAPAPLLTGASIEDASSQFETQNLSSGSAFVVALTFTEDGARSFADILTNSSVLRAGDRLAILLDGVVQSAPTIQPSIVDEARRGWQAVRNGTSISGNFTQAESTNLAIVLKSGNLPVPVNVIFDETIGPSLGQDSINKGLFATVLAGILVLLFMIAYYKLAGFIANFTIALNLAMLVAVMMLLDATWTLPGIAGLILTIGMGVDSNVLIFERVREELRSGKTVRAAIDFGYERALLTIIDAHVTTLITALILFTFGTGAIKGFATTLSIGIFINLFTALIGTRLAFDLIKERQPRRLSI